MWRGPASTLIHTRTGLFMRTVVIKRAEMKIGMANLLYNIRRLIFLERIVAA